MGRVIVEMRVLWVRKRCREPDVGYDVVEARPERASPEGGDCVVCTGVNNEQMGDGQDTESQGNFTNMDGHRAQLSLEVGVEYQTNVVKCQMLAEIG